MLEILIVDDNPKKIEAIKTLISENDLYSNITIETTNFLKDTRFKLQDKLYDLLILDIQLSECSGAQIKKDAGISFVKEIISIKRFKRPANILILSEFEDSIEEYKKEFEENIFHIEKYDIMSDKWQHRLIQIIEHTLLAKESKILSELDYRFDFAIVCALKKELDSVLELEFNWEFKRIYRDDETIYHVGSFINDGTKYKVVCMTPDIMGIADSAIATFKLIEYFKPRYIFMTGIMAGVKEKNKIGDIVVAQPSWHYEFGKYVSIDGERKFQPSATHIRASEKLVSLMSELNYKRDILDGIHRDFHGDKPDKSPNLYVGPVGSGSAVIADNTTIKEIIQQERNLLGIDMEIFGFYKSAYKSFKPKPEFVAIKSICDYADSEKSDDFQDYCSYLTSRVLEHLIFKTITFDLVPSF